MAEVRPVWSKGGDDPTPLVHAFTVGDDWRQDRALAPYDLLGSLAHARMLAATRLIAVADAQALVSGLRQLLDEFQAGAWTVEPSDEDVHSKVEALLTARLGDPGRRLHTGRSRNDQVLTAIRLWTKDRLLGLVTRLGEAAHALLEQARRHANEPFPGYTHLQRAMPSSLGMWFGAHAQALLDDLVLLEAAWTLNDTCPLGFGASYGVGLPLDRALSARLLGFGRPGGLALRDANSRGKCETATLDAAGAVLTDLNRLASDVVFFATAECGFLTIGSGFTTGSSIMPQKRNPDVFELLRGRTARFLGLRTGLAAVLHGLPSGYNRDLQDTKAPLLEGLTLVEQALAVTAAAVPTLAPVRERIQAALTPDLYATDEAYRLVREQGMPFREAYVQVGRNLDQLASPDHEAVLVGRTHLGSTGCLGLDDLVQGLQKARTTWTQRADHLHRTWQELAQAPVQ